MSWPRLRPAGSAAPRLHALHRSLHRGGRQPAPLANPGWWKGPKSKKRKGDCPNDTYISKLRTRSAATPSPRADVWQLFDGLTGDSDMIVRDFQDFDNVSLRGFGHSDDVVCLARNDLVHPVHAVTVADDEVGKLQRHQVVQRVDVGHLAHFDRHWRRPMGRRKCNFAGLA